MNFNSLSMQEICNQFGFENENDFLDYLEKEICEESFYEFVKRAWRYVDTAPFIDGWHIKLICDKLQELSDRKIKRLLINIPPRFSKSTIVSVLFPAWCWIRKRRKDAQFEPAAEKFLTISYAKALSTRDAGKTRRLINTLWFQKHWGDKFYFISDQNVKTHYENNEGGYRKTASTDSSLTGDGGDTILYDDPHNVQETESDTVREGVIAFFDEALQTRLNDPKTGVLCVVMQRIHDKDVSGHILEKYGDDYETVILPMEFELNKDGSKMCKDDPRTKVGELLCPERYDRESVDMLKKALGEYGSSGQLQQIPVPRGGGMFKRHWFEVLDIVPKSYNKIRYWDLAGTGAVQGKNDPDWTVGTLLGRYFDSDGAAWYVVEDVIRFRKSPGETKRLIKETAEHDGKNVVIGLPQDPGQAGKAQAEDYVIMLDDYNVKTIIESGDKVVRADPVASKAEWGRVKLKRAHWNASWLDEFTLFPKSRYKDQVDSCSGGFALIQQLPKPLSLPGDISLGSQKINDFSGL